MRVLLIVNTLPPDDLSGAGEQVVQLAGGLLEHGCEVEILGRGPGGAPGPKVLFPLLVLPAAIRKIRASRPDVVQVHESDGGLVALWCRWRRRWAGKTPLLVALQQVSYVEERRAVRPLLDRETDRVLARPTPVERRWRRRTPLHIFLGRASARAADLVLVPSQKTGREVERHYGVRQTSVVPNATGADVAGVLERLTPHGALEAPQVPPPVEASTATSIGTSGDEDAVQPYFLFVGRLRIRKGVEVLLRAIEHAEGDAGESVELPRLLIVGDGERQRVIEEAIGEAFEEVNVAMLGRKSAAEIAALLDQALALVVPSTYEGMPLVILEAMSRGVPVIASRVSGIPEVVVDGETGWLVESEHPRALSEALLEAAADRREARRRGVAGRRRLEGRYRPVDVAREWLTVVTALLPPAPRDPGEECSSASAAPSPEARESVSTEPSPMED